MKFKLFKLFRHRLWPYVRRYRVLFFASLLVIGVSTLASLAVPWILGYIVDHVFIPKRPELILFAGLAILSMDSLGALTTYLQSFLFALLGQFVLHDLRQDLLLKYQFYPLSRFREYPTGKWVTRLVNDTSSLQDLFTSGFAVAFGNILFVASILIWLVILHPVLGLVCVSVFPVMIFLSRFFARIIRRASHASRRTLAKLNTTLAENISGMNVIQLFNKQNIFKQLFEIDSARYTQMQIKTVESFAYFQPAITILSSLSMSLLIGYGAYLFLHQELSLGLLVAFMSYLQALYAPIRDITEKYNLFLTAMTSCERIFSFMDEPEETRVQSQESEVANVKFSGNVEFKNVSFRYKRHLPWALKNISFTVKAGEHVGVVGFTGAGKTTLASLLMQFYEVEEGQIYMDQKGIETFPDKRILRQEIGFIQQEPFLFSGTVGDNIFLYQNERKNIFNALPEHSRKPFCDGPLHLDKEVLERGANLSLGQRQMISFMRAIVQNPSLFVLDEATAHLDSLTEQWIEKISSEIFKSKTVFIIAHRLSTLKTVDRILVFHHGELVEEGSHFELLKRLGIYEKLYRLQARKEELPEIEKRSYN